MRFILTTTLVATALLAGPALAQPKGCPPGLAKKSPSCVPPGLAKKGAAPDADRYILGADGRIYRVGDSLDGLRPIVIHGWRYRRLPELEDGRAYVELDGKIVEVIRAGSLFVRTIGAVSDLLN